MLINEWLNTINCEIANRTANDIKYIVIHYVGANGGALDNCKYFANGYRGASAHLFVGHNGEIYRCIADKNIAWHCGATYYYNSARNSNSIGIELCCYQDKNGIWNFYDSTINSAVELIKEYMKKYNIPIANVVRHYDVTRKLCPGPLCGSTANDKAWTNFKSKLLSAPTKPPTSTFKPYLVKVTADVLNIRQGAGTSHKVVGSIKYNEVYTIVEEKTGPGAKMWGKLKSGAGWISLDWDWTSKNI